MRLIKNSQNPPKVEKSSQIPTKFFQLGFSGSALSVVLGLLTALEPMVFAGTTPNVFSPAPAKVELVRPTQSSLTLNWQAGGTVAGYWVNYQSNTTMDKNTTKTLDCQFGKQAVKLQSGTQTQYIINNLQPGVYYDVAICSYNRLLLRSEVIRVSRKTLGATSPAPTHFTASSLGSTQLSLTWSASTGTTAGYLLAMQQGNNSNLSCQGGTDLGTQVATRISGLTATTTYSFALCSYNSDNILSPSVVISATTGSENGDGKVLNCSSTDGSYRVTVYHDAVNAASAPTVCPSGSQCYTQNYQMYGAVSQGETTLVTYPVVSSAAISSLQTLNNGATSAQVALPAVVAKGGTNSMAQLVLAMQPSSVTVGSSGPTLASSAVPVAVVDSETTGQLFNLQTLSNSANGSHILNAVQPDGPSLSNLILNCNPKSGK